MLKIWINKELFVVQVIYKCSNQTKPEIWTFRLDLAVEYFEKNGLTFNRVSE